MHIGLKLLHHILLSDIYNKKKIQIFVVNMTFISSHEVKRCIFRSRLRN